MEPTGFNHHRPDHSDPSPRAPLPSARMSTEEVLKALGRYTEESHSTMNLLIDARNFAIIDFGDLNRLKAEAARISSIQLNVPEDHRTPTMILSEQEIPADELLASVDRGEAAQLIRQHHILVSEL